MFQYYLLRHEIPMTDLPHLHPPDHSALALSASRSVEQILKGIEPIAVAVGLVMVALYQWAEKAARTAEEKHLRAERLAAYRLRHVWKASDIRPLLTVGVSQAAQRRIASLHGRGRPIVKQHRSLEDVLSDQITNWSNLLCEDSTPNERRRSFRGWPWWKHHVEALYRGELEQARANRLKGPHDHAERVVARALRMSQGAVHAICGEIRAMRREDAESANFPPMQLSEHEAWMERGKLPKRLSE
jgi:hypothetical protein